MRKEAFSKLLIDITKLIIGSTATVIFGIAAILLTTKK